MIVFAYGAETSIPVEEHSAPKSAREPALAPQADEPEPTTAACQDQLATPNPHPEASPHFMCHQSVFSTRT